MLTLEISQSSALTRFTPTPSFIKATNADDVLHSCHQLGKSTVAQLVRLHRSTIPGQRTMRRMLDSLARNSTLAVIKPIDLNHPSRHMPHLYLDTTASRRHVEQVFGIPFRRPPELPSRDWRFLRHDVTLVDELISFELTARAHGLSKNSNGTISSGWLKRKSRSM